MNKEQKKDTRYYKERLIEKIREVCPWATLQAATERAEKLLGNITKPLSQNLYEWLDNKPLTDIWLDGYCVRHIMEMRFERYPLEALEILALYSKDKKAGTREIWRTRK